MTLFRYSSATTPPLGSVTVYGVQKAPTTVRANNISVQFAYIASQQVISFKCYIRVPLITNLFKVLKVQLSLKYVSAFTVTWA